MNDALRVYDHPHLVHRQAKEPTRLNHLQPLVEKRRRIDGDFGSHFPRGMFQRAFNRDVGKLFLWGFAKRPTGGRQPNLPNRLERSPLKALEDGRVFAVHRKHLDLVPTRLVHHDLTGHDQDFLGGNGDILTGTNGGQCRLQACHANDSNQHNVRFGQRCQFYEAIIATMDLG